MYHPTGFLPSSRSQFPSYSPPTLGIPRAESSGSHSPQVSPLITPNGSFETLQNFSPPLHAPGPGPILHKPTPGTYAQYMMPMQHVKMLQHMWGPSQLASTPPILMQHDGVLQDSTAPVVNAGTTSKKGGSRKRKKPVEEVDGQNNTRRQSNKKKKTNSGAVQLPEAAAVCGVGPVTPVSNPAPENAPADGQHPPLPGNVNQVLEALQILKFSYKQDRLDFTSHLVAEEMDYNISGPVSRNTIDELVAAGKLDELAQLLANENEEA
ncbi:hypothetical protein EV424DRAFT_1543786 [Suillus variegatus]|nr:hypothetical protein EV424DRAFT_1543786 [Suillus variegatus]